MKKVMTRFIVALSLLLAGVTATIAQEVQANYALIDMQYLMDQIPQYKTANEQIQKQTEKWTKEINALNEQAKQLYISYQQDLDKLTPDDRVKRENAIVQVEDKAAELQLKYFGREGEALKLQQKLIKPIQDSIYKAVKLISERRGYLIVFDRASSVGSIIYADPKADISNDVLAVLGFSE
ncbi:MAG: OmpH family outer membrane protein [Porphyromonas sp.]|nr:OmpH family outer membrane protein [Porphyromonas sp.]